MLNSVASEGGNERVLIASADPNMRRHIGEIAKLAQLRAVGFVREADKILARTSLSAPGVLLLDADLHRQLQQQHLCLDGPHLCHTKVVLFGRRLSGGMTAQWKAQGIHGTFDLQGPAGKDLGSYAVDLRHAINRCSADSITNPQCVIPPNAAIAAIRKVLQPKSVVIGSSTGGPVALLAVLKALPASFPLPIAIVQHMPPGFTSMLAERLNAECSLRIVEASAGMEFQPGSVYIAPGGHHMTLEGTSSTPRIGLNSAPPENSCRPAVDVLFRSSAKVFGGNQHAIVLTGMGRDGLVGVSELRGLGSRIVVQDAATSTVWGMPGAIAQAGFADDILPLEQIAPQLLRCL